MFQTNPFAANNGLRVIGRTSQSIWLTWRIEVEGENEETNDGRESKGSSVKVENVKKDEKEESCGSDESLVESVEVERNNNWYHVQMKKGENSRVWESVYKGYSLQHQINGLPPDTVYVFRMKRNDEDEWGSEITASTETLPASVEDFNRAVEMRSEYLVSRILKLTRPFHLKRILQTRDRNGMTSLMVASQMGNASVVEKLISIGVDINAVSSGCLRTSLMFACMSGHIDVAISLDRNGANWGMRDKSGCTAMDYAINCGNLPLVKLAYSRLGKVCLIEPDYSGWTPLMKATIISDNLSIIKFLLKKGADINYVSPVDGKTPLLGAILAKKVKFVQFLLDHGANPFHTNFNGTSCLQAARGLQFREITEIIAKCVQQQEK